MSAYITLLGAPGSGKGTQSLKLSKILEIPTIGIGDLIRNEIAKKSELGLKVEPLTSRGQLVPDDIITNIFKDNITKQMFEKGVISDGYPRNLKQAQAFQDIFLGKPLKTIIIYLDVPPQVLKARLFDRKRADDTEEVIETRNKVYAELTRPILDFFGDKVFKINGNSDQESIFSELQSLVKRHA